MLIAGNYFGGDVALLADSLVESVQWSDAIKNATRPRMYGSTKIKNAPEMKGNMWPYSEYYLVNNHKSNIPLGLVPILIQRGCLHPDNKV